MKNKYCGALLLLLLAISSQGCEKKTTQDKSAVKNDVVSKAILKFDTENGIGSHENYDTLVRETEEEWRVHFEGKKRLPGNHAFVVIKKSTGEMKYMHGE